MNEEGGKLFTLCKYNKDTVYVGVVWYKITSHFHVQQHLTHFVCCNIMPTMCVGIQ